MRKSRKKSSANQANRPKTAEDGAKAFANLDLTTVSSLIPQPATARILQIGASNSRTSSR